MKKKNFIFSITALLTVLPTLGSSTFVSNKLEASYRSNHCTIVSDKRPFLVEFLPISEDTIPLHNLVENYKPQTVLNYDDARALLYTQIYNVNDTVSCMYSGYQSPLLQTEENPIMKLMKLNVFNSILTEHSFPKSKGAAEGNAKSDMHHLFPVRLGVNVSRYNHPFAEVLEEECDVWYIDTEKYNSKPDKNESHSAKEGNGKFEPQDSFKGNVARAVFYFYTMYQLQADLADDSFFELQKETLLAWHNQDPVDELELKRTYLIAKYQSDKPNPFVLDASLAGRLYVTETAFTE